ncbi:MAG: GTP-binding protein [Lachnospiraceae bacterium]|nr:GTP-binding protein [Lachnospiraceae bacterium]
MTKVDIVSGFLGAGKTTLIKKLISEAFTGEKLVLIENEFGEIGIDGGFLKDAGIEITEMNSGCICCSLVGDFGTALKKVLTEYVPDRIIIEPSGVGKLSDVIKAVQGVAEDTELELDSFVTVADATKAKMYMKNFGEFFNNQVESASTIILSRTQKMSQDKLEAVVALLKEHNDKATIITTPWEDIDGTVIRKAMTEGNSLLHEMLEEAEICPECGHHHHDGECHHDHDHDHGHEEEHHHHDGECHHDHDHEHEEDHHHHDHDHHHEHGEDCTCGCHDHDHHHHHADEVFTSWGKETPHKYTDADMESILKQLSETEEYGVILRAKGMVPNVNGEWIYFDLVPGEYEMRKGTPDYTGKLCVIGSQLKEDKLTELFQL